MVPISLTETLTESRPELDEQEQRSVNERLALIAEHIKLQPVIRIQYLGPDERKTGAIAEFSG